MGFFRQEYCKALHTFSSSRGFSYPRTEPMSPVSPAFQVDSLLTEPSVHFSSFQSLSRVWLFMTPWTVPRQTSLSITNSQSYLKLMSIESVMPSNHLILCLPFSSSLQSFPASGSFQISQFFTSGGQSIAAGKLFSSVCWDLTWAMTGSTGHTRPKPQVLVSMNHNSGKPHQGPRWHQGPR